MYVFHNCTALEEINIPDGVTELQDNLFQRCQNLTNISIPNSIETIGQEVFENCNNLQNITLPYGLTSIGDNAFASTGFQYLSLPETVTSIGEGVFANCIYLERLAVYNPIPILINENTFENTPTNTCVLVVPDGSVSDYQSALVWNQFDIIIDFTTGNLSGKVVQPIIFADGDLMVIKGAKENSEVKIYTITGSLIKTFTTSTDYDSSRLRSGNVYIVKVNGVNYKVVM